MKTSLLAKSTEQHFIYWRHKDLQEKETPGRASQGKQLSTRWCPGDPDASRLLTAKDLCKVLACSIIYELVESLDFLTSRMFWF